MNLDTIMEGSSESVDSAARWLEELGQATSTAEKCLAMCGTAANAALHGAMARAYAGLIGQMHTAGRELNDRVHSAQDRFKSYSQQLRWRQEDMAAHRNEALKGGLSVSGTVIEQPPDPGPEPQLPANYDDAQLDTYRQASEAFYAAKDKVALFERLTRDVTATNLQLDNWIAKYLGQEQADLSRPSALAKILGALDTPDAGVSVFESSLTSQAKEYYALADRAAETIARNRARLPDIKNGERPPSKAGLEKARQAPLPRSLRTWGDLADGAAKLAGGVSKVLTGVGLVVSGVEIANGDSPLGVIVGAVGGVAGAAIFGSLVGAGVIAGPAIVVGALGVVAAGAAGVGAVAALEAWVPQATREKFDEGFRDVMGPVVRAPERVWKALFG